MVALVLGGAGLYALAWAWCGKELLAALVCWWRLRADFPGVLPARLPALSWSGVRGSLGRGFWVSVGQVAQVLLHGSDLLLLSRLLGPLAVVPYDCTLKLIRVAANQPLSVMHNAAPMLSEMKAGESPARLFRVSTALSQALLLLTGGVVFVVLAV